ncbi:MAG TPA: tRNA 2-thiouridine(34) synthase MnmA [Mycobacteriales bacterium]|nr:tRNA 2-thiouridine(34) synthase MnmA [Mycobacteriales bacterium]
MRVARPRPQKVLAALSGGVDSAVAAARAVDAGHDVTCVHLALTHGIDGSGCCTPDDARDAARVADVLGVPYYVWDLADTFAASVIDDFVASYASGQTPNPCVRCNERIKFAAVLDRARALGFDGLVTGHHARVADGVLRRSVDRAKDQSYVLGTLRRDQLAGAVFPVGTSTKQAVRAEARERGLLVSEKPDSFDVCFTGQDTAGFLRAALGPQPGPIVDREGAVVGAHDGAYAFTVGQRRGVPLGGGTREPRYVLSIEPASRTVVVGSREELAVTSLTGTASTYEGPSRSCDVQLRAHADPIAADVTVRGDELAIALHEPAFGIAPGQAVVLYDGDVVLGGAWISSTNVGA